MSKWLSHRMVERGIIKEENEELYQFGIRNGIIIILNIITAVLIGLLTARLWIVLVFTVSFMMLRSYSGGYHCDNRIFCYIGSNAVLLIPIYTQTAFLRIPIYAVLLILAASEIVIIIFSPMNSRNRKLDPAERIYFGRRARIASLFQMAVFFLLWHIGYLDYAYAVYASIYITAFFMLIGKAQLHIQHHMD